MQLIPHSSWNVKDATKLQAYMDCPRSYFYEFILGWRSDRANVHLEFGSAWHLAMEHLIWNGYNEVSILEAYQKLEKHYRQYFTTLQDDENHPKNPAMALQGLIRYCQEYKDERYAPLFTEVAGSVTLNENHTLSFKIDSILKTDLGIKSREHKTGSQLSRQWMDQWALKMQTGVYNHVLYCLFPRQDVWGVEINGAIFSKKEVKFQRVPARRTVEGMEAWYWNTIAWCDEIDRDISALLQDAKEDDATMKCFKMNTENCTKYFGCRYHDFCLAWGNPLSRCEEVPVGFKIEYWDPRNEEAEAKTIFRINEEGVKQER